MNENVRHGVWNKEHNFVGDYVDRRWMSAMLFDIEQLINRCDHYLCRTDVSLGANYGKQIPKKKKQES